MCYRLQLQRNIVVIACYCLLQYTNPTSIVIISILSFFSLTHSLSHTHVFSLMHGRTHARAYIYKQLLLLLVIFPLRFVFHTNLFCIVFLFLCFLCSFSGFLYLGIVHSYGLLCGSVINSMLASLSYLCLPFITGCSHYKTAIVSSQIVKCSLQI